MEIPVPQTPAESAAPAASAGVPGGIIPAPAEPGPGPRRSLGDRVLKAGIAVLAAHACVKLAGLLLKNVIPNYYGLAVSDVFTVVYDTVLGTAFYVGEQYLAPAYLPVFTRAREQDGEARAWRFTSILFNFQFVVLAMLVAALIAWPAPIIGAFTQWDPPRVDFTTRDGKKISGELLEVSGGSFRLRVDGREESVPVDQVANAETVLRGESVDSLARKLEGGRERRELAAKMLPYIAPGLLGMSLASLTYVLLNGYKEFFFAAFGDAVLKLSIMLGALIGAFIGKGDWRYVAGGAVIGGTMKLCTHAAAIGFKRLRLYTFSFDLADPHVRAFFMLVLPLLAGILLSRGRDAVMINLLTTREGLPSYYGMGRSIVDTISFLVPYTLSIALLPFFCDLSARDDRQQLGEVLTRIVRMLFWFFVPLGIVLAVAALPISLFFFGGKKITLDEAAFPALVLRIFCLQLPFHAIEMMVMQAYFSSRRVIAPTIAGFAFSLLSPLVAFHLIKERRLDDGMQMLAVVAGCYVGARVLKSFVLVALLKWTVPVLPLAQTAAFAARLAVAGIGAAAAALGMLQLCVGPLHALTKAGRVGSVVEIAAIMLSGGAVYLALSLLLKMEEPRECWRWTREKLRHRGAGKIPPVAGGAA